MDRTKETNAELDKVKDEIFDLIIEHVDDDISIYEYSLLRIIDKYGPESVLASIEYNLSALKFCVENIGSTSAPVESLIKDIIKHTTILLIWTEYQKHS